MNKSLVSFALLVAAFACGSSDEHELPEVDCSVGDIPSFANVQAFESVCTNCHSSQLDGEDRNGAPAGYNFDLLEAARDEATEIAAEVFEGEMPPEGSGFSLNEAQKTDLYRWALCGTPE